MYCLDASVIINAARPKEPYSDQSRAFLNQIKEKRLKVFFPEVIIPEITSGLFRATKDPKAAFKLALSLRTIPNFSFVPVDRRLAELASWVICKTNLKGIDAIYIALALDYNLELITLDKEQLEMGSKLVKVRKP